MTAKQCFRSKVLNRFTRRSAARHYHRQAITLTARHRRFLAARAVVGGGE